MLYLRWSGIVCSVSCLSRGGARIGKGSRGSRCWLGCWHHRHSRHGLQLHFWDWRLWWEWSNLDPLMMRNTSKWWHVRCFSSQFPVVTFLFHCPNSKRRMSHSVTWVESTLCLLPGFMRARIPQEPVSYQTYIRRRSPSKIRLDSAWRQGSDPI